MLDKIIGDSQSIKNIRATVEKFAPLDITVLISGESGCGKEVAARALHEYSPRAEQAFVAANCGAISESLLETELFGHEKGAFTGANKARQGLFVQAGNGTLFLDEIGEIPLKFQVALLRVLETGEIRPVGSDKNIKIKCRILAATNANLDHLSDLKYFRKDLLFRLKRLEVYIPPLRSRPDDIEPLVYAFLKEQRGSDDFEVAPALLQKLKSHTRPGNVRELKNIIDQMALLYPDEKYFTPPHLDKRLLSATGAKSKSGRLASPFMLGTPLEAEEEAKDKRLASAFTERGFAPTAHTPNSSDIRQVIGAGTTKLRRLEKIKKIFIKAKQLSRAEVVKLIGVSANTVTKDLQELCKEGFLEKIKPSASARSHYFSLTEN